MEENKCVVSEWPSCFRVQLLFSLVIRYLSEIIRLRIRMWITIDFEHPFWHGRIPPCKF